ncbi:uncharacterized protein LOC127711282 isoform X3 [Mytilus californianus]|nr:uncharacterized protein LOC127711282 isoform X3 [Mytilus californianus]
MASASNFCNLCEEEDVFNVAVVWCADCETFLCKDCERHHGRIKASKGHQTITLEEYKKLPSFIVNIKSRCEKHDEKYNFYCKFHGDPCCVKCIKDNHKDCRGLDSLVEVLKDIKTSAKVSNLEKELKILLEDFETVVKHLNSRITVLQENESESLKEIQNLRASINNHLDNIEKKIVDDLSMEFNKIKLKSYHLSTEIGNKKEVIQILQNDLLKMKMYATDLKTYVGLQYLEKYISPEVEYLHDLQSKGQLDDIRIESKLSFDLKCLTNNIRTFGTAITHASACTLKLKTSSADQVHQSVSPLLTIDNINPNLKTTLKIPKIVRKLEIHGCQVLPDGRKLILDFASKSLLLFSKDGRFTETVTSFYGQPSDVCFIKGNLIAVTIFNLHKILLIDIEKKIITRTIEVEDFCYGIDSNGKKLVVTLHSTCSERGYLTTLDLEGNILSSIRVLGEFTLRLSLLKDNIVVTNWNANVISCYTNNGVLLWRNKHEDIREPFGIAVDKHGFIFVACRANDSILVLSEDGMTSKTILSKENEIDKPYAISIDKSSSTLLVANRSKSKAFVYEI